VLAVGALSGCATPQPVNPEEIISRRDVRSAAATWTFNGFTKKEITSALIKTFEYLDKPDVNFDIRENKVLVSRFWTYYAVFSVGAGRDFWEFRFDGNDGQKSYTLKAAYGGESSQGMFISFPSKMFDENLEVSGQVGPSANSWNFLHDRVAYFLGLQSQWPICNDYRGKPPEGKLSAAYLAFCDDIGIEDRAPTASDKSAGRAAQ
jgi:hypothetical protein